MLDPVWWCEVQAILGNSHSAEVVEACCYPYLLRIPVEVMRPGCSKPSFGEYQLVADVIDAGIHGSTAGVVAMQVVETGGSVREPRGRFYTRTQVEC